MKFSIPASGLLFHLLLFSTLAWGKNLELHKAVLNQDYDQVLTLLKNGSNPNSLDSKRQTPLHLAAKNGLPWIAEILLEYGANKKLRTTNGQFAEDLAKGNGYLETLYKIRKSKYSLGSGGQKFLAHRAQRPHDNVVLALHKAVRNNDLLIYGKNKFNF